MTPAAGQDPDGNELTDVVAIDGPAGSGKSTVARGLALRLGFRYLDTGAMYRAVTWFVQARGKEPSQELLEELALEFTEDGRVLVGQQDVTGQLRSPAVESDVSRVAALPLVRRYMRVLQRRFAAAGSVVAEGRDMGSVVFPKARWKFFLDADEAERARRRQRDFEASGREVSEATVRSEMQQRDALDSSRKEAPLTRAKDAVVVDTTNLDSEQVIDELDRRVRGTPR